MVLKYELLVLGEDMKENQGIRAVYALANGSMQMQLEDAGTCH